MDEFSLHETKTFSDKKKLKQLISHGPVCRSIRDAEENETR